MRELESPLHFGFQAVGAFVPKVWLANPEKNVQEISKVLTDGKFKNIDFLVFPELCITGYSLGDLFLQDRLLNQAVSALINLADSLRTDNRLICVGVPLKHKGKLYNCAAAICNGKVLGIVPKSYIPNYQEFYEKRWFESGIDVKNDYYKLDGEDIPFGTDVMFLHNGITVGIEICEDLWVPIPPSSFMCKAGATLILNLSATDEVYGKHAYLRSLVSSQSAKCRCAYVYASAGTGESSTDLVFAGNAMIGYDNEIVNESERFSFEGTFATAYIDIEKLENDRKRYSSFYDNPENINYRIISSGVEKNCPSSPVNDEILNEIRINPIPFVPASKYHLEEKCKEIINIQSWGLRQRLSATGCKKLVVGVSGGLDSTLALLVAVHTFKSMNLPTENIVAVTMPGKATSSRTFNNALEMMKLLKVTSLEIPIGEAVNLHFRQIGHDPAVKNAVYENSQARERTQILMDLANKEGGMVLGTGDLSELALGWCTYNGDQMSMYNVNGGVPKTLVKYLVEWFADSCQDARLSEVLKDIIDTPISPELIPAENDNEISQKTEELVGPYELHDFFIYHFLRNGFSPEKIFWLARIAFHEKYDDEIIRKWLKEFYRRFFNQQFKRSCMPDGPKVGSVSLSPRGDWRMPSDASSAIWMEALK